MIHCRGKVTEGNLGFLSVRISGRWNIDRLRARRSLDIDVAGPQRVRLDEIAPRLVGPLLERHPSEAGRVLDGWARDPDFWVRRAALLALLLPMRRGEGDWKRCERYADPLLEDREFFIRKAIGWILREAAKVTPERVIAFVEPRAARLSGVTWREATRKLPVRVQQRLRARRG